MTEMDEKRAAAELELRAKSMSPESIDDLIRQAESIEDKLEQTPEMFRKLVLQIHLLFGLLRAYWRKEYRQVPWNTIAVAAAAVTYFMAPSDVVPDFIPLAGFVDDATVVAFAIKALRTDLRVFCEQSGLSPTQYYLPQ